jgi:hypothetical protein
MNIGNRIKAIEKTIENNEYTIVNSFAAWAKAVIEKKQNIKFVGQFKQWAENIR